jgi:signal transduction histidine kinase
MTAPADIPEEVSRVRDADVRAALGSILHGSLRPLVVGLAGLYGVYALGHPVFVGGQTGTILAVAAVGTAVFFLGLRLGWNRLPSRVPWPHALGTGITAVVLANTLLHFYLTDGLIQTTNVILLLLGVGFLSLSTPWYVLMAGLTLGGWGLVVWATLPHAQLAHYGFAMLSAAVLATVVHVARRRSTASGQRDRLRGKQLQAALGRSLRAEAATRRALEDSNQALEKAVEEAEEMNRLQAAFLADMSHEIRTPLTSIIGFAEVLDEKATGDSRRFAQLILESSQRLLDTVNSVLDLSKLNTESVHLNPEPVDVAAEVRDTVRLFRAQAEENGLALTVDAPDTLDATLDPSALHRCCSNLVGNAIKYTEDGGSVAVRVRGADDQVVVTVEDTGVGIDPGFRDALFEPFEQSGGSGVLQDERGTGLGLAITRRLVSLMDGTIDVESAPGEGSTFTLRVPRRMEGTPDD